MKYKTIVFLSVMSTALPFLAWTQVFEKSRHESKAFRVYDETSLEIYNKYGNIRLFTWEKDSVKIDISMQIKSGKEAKLEKIYEYIDFEFSDSKYYIIARTRLNQQGAFWAEVSDLANAFFSGGTSVRIDYDVYLPAEINIRLENKFGNIYTTNHSGKVTVVLSNGDLKANNLTGSSDLQVSFGNASVNAVGPGKLTLNYGEIAIVSAGSLSVESKSATLNIGKVGTLDINSRRDKYIVDEVASVTGTTSFTYLTLKNLSSDLTLKADYGEIKLEAVNPEFKQVEINSNYTDLLLRLPVNVSYGTEIDHTGTTEITSPQNYSGLKTEVTDKKEDRYHTGGTAGSGVLKRGKISISMISGKISFREIP